MKKETHEDKMLAKKVKEVLDDNLQGFNGSIQSRLAESRSKALAALPDHESRHRWFSGWFGLPTLSVASLTAVLILAVVFYSGEPSRHLAIEAVDDVDILFSDEDPDFLAELDFYIWLTEQEENAG